METTESEGPALRTDDIKELSMEVYSGLYVNEADADEEGTSAVKNSALPLAVGQLFRCSMTLSKTASTICSSQAQFRLTQRPFLCMDPFDSW